MRQATGIPSERAPLLQRHQLAPNGSFGKLFEDADLLDQAVEHAVKVGEERPWRLNPVE
jgi:hypothetical protein